jgi:hypothetical protein
MKTEKLILVNKSDLTMCDFLTLCKSIIATGRISNDNTQYTYLTSFKIFDDNNNLNEYHIVSDKNKKSDRLTFYKSKKQ